MKDSPSNPTRPSVPPCSAPFKGSRTVVQVYRCIDGEESMLLVTCPHTTSVRITVKGRKKRAA